MLVTTEPSDEGNLSLGFTQLRTHQHLQRNTTNAWYETSNHLTSTYDTNDQAKQCNSTRHVIKQCNSARHVIRLISGGIETTPSQLSSEKQNKNVWNSGRNGSSDSFLRKLNIRKMFVECRIVFCQEFHCLKKISLVFRFKLSRCPRKGRFCLL